MATEYTRLVQENDDVPLRDFALRCARGMVACYHQREQSLSAPPREAKPDTGYYDATIIFLQEKIKKLEETSKELYLKEKRKRFQTNIEAAKISQEKIDKVKDRYWRMFRLVTAWEPPTPEHEGLRSFMIEQLQDSMRFDCFVIDPPVFDETTYEKDLEDLREELKEAEISRQEEIDRAEKRNLWIRQLYSAFPEK